MKKHHFITAVLLTCMSAPVFSQDTTDNAEIDEREFHFHACSFSVSTGMHKDKLTHATLLGFENLAPNSPLVNEVSDLADYNDQSNFYYYNSMTNTISFMLGFDFPDYDTRKYACPRLNLGLSYNNSEYKELHVRYEETTPYDTLTSEITDNVIYMDSVIKHEYDMSYYSEQIRLDGNYVYRSDPAKRFSFYAGMGVNVGVSINTYSTISYERNHYVRTSFNGDGFAQTSGYFDSEARKSEQITHKMNVGGMVYLPVGLNFRIGNKKHPWKELHLFIELQPGVNLVYIPELTTYTYGIFQSNFGVKYEW
ncbi:MAG: hypothetical protein PF590_07985 [Candidatus Delongbacteria bacterium]|jgi:hypothetical protein|nr:hypothetical protein [Candidatus Delongbacteria bacterium]